MRRHGRRAAHRTQLVNGLLAYARKLRIWAQMPCVCAGPGFPECAACRALLLHAPFRVGHDLVRQRHELRRAALE